MEVGKNCYCCAESTTLKPVSTAMDLDAALNELGMLSSVTQSRKQYMHEKERECRRQLSICRERNLSEPSLSYPTPATPSNSPNRASSYQILQLNTHFVTSLSAGSAPRLAADAIASTPECAKQEPAPGSPAKQWLNFGSKYEELELEQQTRANRVAKIKGVRARAKRFKRPYEVPWKQTIDTIYRHNYAPSSASSDNQYSVSTSTYSTPEKPRIAEKACSSNASTPEKNSSSSSAPDRSHSSCTVTRSRSLDDLDFAKLRLAETENHNFLTEHREIDKMSQHLNDLHVQE